MRVDVWTESDGNACVAINCGIFIILLNYANVWGERSWLTII